MLRLLFCDNSLGTIFVLRQPSPTFVASGTTSARSYEDLTPDEVVMPVLGSGLVLVHDMGLGTPIPQHIVVLTYFQL